MEFFLTVLSIFGFSVVQPLLEILTKNPEFLVIRRASNSEIITATLLVLFLIPLILTGVRIITFPIRFITERIVYYFILTLSGLLISKSIVIAIPFAILVTELIIKSQKLRSFICFLNLANLFFVFLFLNTTLDINFGSKSDQSHGINSDPSKLRPTFVIIFDEFPLFTIMDKNQNINEKRFPGFAELAKYTTWFRNGSSLTSWTERAVPAILSGVKPDENKKQLPSIKDYPQNIFTLFSGTHKIFGFEQVTSLCPTDVCFDVVSEEIFSERMKTLLEDLSVIYAHRIAPDTYKSNLPTIEGKWGNFIEHNDTGKKQKKRKSNKGLEIKENRGDDVALFNKFLNSIRTEIPKLDPAKQPPLYVIHVTFPHVPYRYLPDGKKYFLDRNVTNDQEYVALWAKDANSGSATALKRLIMQVGVTDKLISDFLKELKSLNILEKSAIVVTADHGSSFEPGEYSRRVSDKNWSDVMSVPFFISLPQSKTTEINKTGTISDLNINSADVIPTLLELNGITPKTALEGHSLSDPNFPKRDKKEFYPLVDGKNKLYFSNTMDRSKSINRMIDLFGESGFDERFYQFASVNKPLLNNIFSKKDTFWNQNLSVNIHKKEKYLNLKSSPDYLPIAIQGFIKSKNNEKIIDNSKYHLALSVNCKISTIVQTEPAKDGKANFFAILSPYEIKPGRIELDGAVFK
jgi:hypothetical protein